MYRFGILRGGVGAEYHFSLESGAELARALQESGFEVIDILVDKKGDLFLKGAPASLEQIDQAVDLVWNTLHGEIGEDGQIQKLLDNYNIPYTGAGHLSSAITFQKELAKEKARSLGIKTPISILFLPEGQESVSEITRKIYTKMAPPWVLKPLYGGASVHTYFAFTILELAQFVEEQISHSVPFIVEQYIFGKEALIGVVDNFRGQDTYVLPPVEVASLNNKILKTEDRHQEHTYKVGGSFSQTEKEILIEFAKNMHKSFDLKDYSQIECIVDRQGSIWFIEIDTHPHLHKESGFRKALTYVGASLNDFVKSIVERNK